MLIALYLLFILAISACVYYLPYFTAPFLDLTDPMGSMVYAVLEQFRWLILILFIVPLVRMAFKSDWRFGSRTGKLTTRFDLLTWSQFEELVADYYREQGFKAKRVGADGGGDGGVDVKYWNHNKELFLVQCKHWRRQSVGVKVVREIAGVVLAEGATGGVVVTSGRFSDEAKRFGRQAKVELIDGNTLSRLVNAM